MDKLPSDVTDRINSAVKSIGDSMTGILANSFYILNVIYFNCLLTYHGTVLLNLHVKRS